MSEHRSPSLPPYSLSPDIWTMMLRQKIVDPHETSQDVLQRVIGTLFEPEIGFGTPSDVATVLQEQFAQYMVDGYVIPGTPTLTNAGRHPDSALSSCVVIPADLNNKGEAAKTIKSYYAQNMGSGFDFTSYDDPVELIKWLNQLSADETITGLYDRYIGNMGSLHITHPRILEFIDLKREDGVIPHFNISVDLSNEFMHAVAAGEQFTLADGNQVNAMALFNRISENAWLTGDPGVLFLERINGDNPVPAIGRYITTPPCGEMGLAEGETCQFGYLNLVKFIDDQGQVNYDQLRDVTALTTRVLDNAVEYSIGNYPTLTSANVARLKRKIGIGVCGLDEMLLNAGLPYDSDEARTLARDVLSFINYSSKVASVDLADQRGACGAMRDLLQNRYRTDEFLEAKYGNRPTNSVSAEAWRDLGTKIRKTGRLRNILTTALPPTGRASVILGVTSAIEPRFSVYDRGGQIHNHIEVYVRRTMPDIADRAITDASQRGSFQDLDYVPQHIRNVLRTAKEISSYGHIAMVGALAGIQGVIDEAASKTVNLPVNASVEDVGNIFLQAYQLGLKNIAVYRDRTKQGQPYIL